VNEAFGTMIAANDGERRDLFLAAAAHLGTAVQNVDIHPLTRMRIRWSVSARTFVPRDDRPEK